MFLNKKSNSKICFALNTPSKVIKAFFLSTSLILVCNSASASPAIDKCDGEYALRVHTCLYDPLVNPESGTCLDYAQAQKAQCYRNAGASPAGGGGPNSGGYGGGGPGIGGGGGGGGSNSGGYGGGVNGGSGYPSNGRGGFGTQGGNSFLSQPAGNHGQTGYGAGMNSFIATHCHPTPLYPHPQCVFE